VLHLSHNWNSLKDLYSGRMLLFVLSGIPQLGQKYVENSFLQRGHLPLKTSLGVVAIII